MRLRVALLGIVDHLAHEHPSVFVERNRDRIAHEWFVGGEFKFEARLHLPRGDCVCRLDRRIARQVFRRIDRRRTLGFTIGLAVGVAELDSLGSERGAANARKNGEEERFHRKSRGWFS